MNFFWIKTIKISLSAAVTMSGFMAGSIQFMPLSEVDAALAMLPGISTAATASSDLSFPVDSEDPNHSAQRSINSQLAALPREYFTPPQPVEVAVPDKDTTTNYVYPLVQTPPQVVNSTISIPGIDLENVGYTQSSLQDITDIDNKLLYGPVIDTTFTKEPCTPFSHTYMMGHSEPSHSWQSSHPGAYIFNRLHQLGVGSTIHVTNGEGIQCTYQVTGWEKVTTVNDQVSREVYQSLIFPDTSEGSVLSIQTCELGSATVRLILRARMI